eukprot:752248-Prymnesium_polylepis.1
MSHRPALVFAPRTARTQATPRPGYSTSTARCLMTCTCLVRGEYDGYVVYATDPPCPVRP